MPKLLCQLTQVGLVRNLGTANKRIANIESRENTHRQGMNLRFTIYDLRGHPSIANLKS